MDQIRELLNRGVAEVYPSKEALEKVLRSGKKLRVYQGFDPTGPFLHLGHLVGLLKLRQFQKLGHEVIFLIGDFTGQIGDPSGKTQSRKMLSSFRVWENAKTYQSQAEKILAFSGPNPVQLKYNSSWLNKLSAFDFLKIASYFSAQQIIEREMFQERIKKGQDLFLNEFLYPLLQAYDSVALETDVEIGGTDQLFNMLAGRQLLQKMRKKEKFVITVPLLTDTKGRKIGKTEGNVIPLSSPPELFYGQIMNLPDEAILPCFYLITETPLKKIKEYEKAINLGENPMIYKKKLAFALVEMLHDSLTAQKAQETFEKVFQKRKFPEKMPILKLKGKKITLLQFLVENKLTESASSARRLIQQGGVKIDREKITNPYFLLEIQNPVVLKVGKKSFYQIFP